MRRVSARCCFLPGIVACVVSSSSWVLACDDVAAVRAKVGEGDPEGRPITLSANTPSSRISTFALGQPVTLGFKAAGMQPGQDGLKLELHFVDETDRTVKRQAVAVRADAQGEWTKEIAAPCGKMGFWRVFVRLSNGCLLYTSPSPRD